MPLSFLLAVLNSPASTRAQKIRAAEVACAYCHPRLNAVAVSSHVGGNVGGGSTGDRGGDIVQIFAVPRGAAIDVRNGTVTIDGAATELSPVTPYEGTPALTDQTQPEPIAEPLPVVEVDTANVTRLDFERAKRDDPDGGA
jgi:hypothetical protein